MSDHIGYRLWNFLRASENCETIEELDKLYFELLVPHGVTSSGVAVINKPKKMIKDGFGLIDPEWSQIYMQNGYLRHDPIFRSAIYRGTSGLWALHLDGLNLTAAGDRVMSDARAFGINDGYTRIMKSVEPGGVFLLCLQGDRMDDSPDTQTMIETASEKYLKEALNLLTLKAVDEDEPEIVFTSKQRQVMDLLTEDGLSQKEIADKLEISARTVEKHVRDIKERLGAKSSWDAARIAFENGLHA